MVKPDCTLIAHSMVEGAAGSAANRQTLTGFGNTVGQAVPDDDSVRHSLTYKSSKPQGFSTISTNAENLTLGFLLVGRQ